MNPTVISSVRQKFNGHVYYLCGKYFQRPLTRKTAERLHIAVWSHRHGKPPKGHHVHHKNGDRSDNRIENLELKTASQHSLDHWEKNPQWREESRERLMRLAQPKAIEWLKSPAGRKMMAEKRELSRKKVMNMPKVKITCIICGKKRMVNVIHKDRSHFCGAGSCAQKALRLRRKGLLPRLQPDRSWSTT